MPVITLKSDDKFLETLDTMAKELKINRSELIRRSVLRFREEMDREKLKAQIKEASLRVREDAKMMAKELEGTLGDGLDNV